MVFKRIATFLTVLVFSLTSTPSITLADVGDENAGSFDDPDQIEESESTVDEGDAGAAEAAAAATAVAAATAATTTIIMSGPRERHTLRSIPHRLDSSPTLWGEGFWPHTGGVPEPSYPPDDVMILHFVELSHEGYYIVTP